MPFNFYLCETFTLPSFVCKKRSKKRRDVVEDIMNDINSMLVKSTFDKSFIFTHVLHKLVQLSASEYGIIGKVIYSESEAPYLKTLAITNSAWNSASKDFFFQRMHDTLEFRNLSSFFGQVILSGEPVIVNNYAHTKRSVLPPGHPMIKRFMGVPYCIGGKSLIVFGVANKKKKYTARDIRDVKTILSLVGYLCIDILM